MSIVERLSGNATVHRNITFFFSLSIKRFGKSKTSVKVSQAYVVAQGAPFREDCIGGTLLYPRRSFLGLISSSVASEALDWSSEESEDGCGVDDPSLCCVERE